MTVFVCTTSCECITKCPAGGERNAEEAVDTVKREHFDVVLMDELFPGSMQGHDAIRAIREREAHRLEQHGHQAGQALPQI